MSCSQYVTFDDLDAVGLTACHVHKRCPWVVEYTDLNGKPCWLRCELAPVLGDADGRDWK
jgi:hypothetical protein